MTPIRDPWVRELSWPYRNIGTQDDPRVADAQGNFTVANLFAGPIRISASSPIQQESRGNWQGEIRHEGDNLTAVIRIGAAGTGSVSVLVVDSKAKAEAAAPVLCCRQHKMRETRQSGSEGGERATARSTRPAAASWVLE